MQFLHLGCKMATSLTEFQTLLGYHLGCTISSTSRWTTDQTKELLNQALKKIVNELYLNRCWKLLRVLEDEAEYTLTGSESYNVYDVIGDTDYLGFVCGTVDGYPLYEKNAEEEYTLMWEDGHIPTATNPWIIFYGYDSTEGHGNLPTFKIRPITLTGTLKFKYLKNPPAMNSSPQVDSCLPEVCDNAILFLAAAYCWSGDRNSGEFSRFYQLYKKEIEDLIAKYSEPFYHSTYL